MEIGKATLLHINCMTYMRTLKDGEFDLAIVDPPYGINIAKTGYVGAGHLAPVTNYGAREWDLSPPDAEYFTELRRISKNQIIWGANHFIDRVPIPSSCWVVWDKVNGTTDFADCELALTSFNKAVRKFTFQWNGMLQGDMKNKEKRIHPTQKPVKLYEWLLTRFAQKGHRVIDTHLGSASSTIACNNLGFEMVGCELDKEYYEAACARVTDSIRQERMFE